METREIRLSSRRLKDWLEIQEQRITGLRDELSLLESQVRRLSGIWEGEAGRQWEMVFEQRLSEAGGCISRMEELLLKTEETAASLEQTEKGLKAEAERI